MIVPTTASELSAPRRFMSSAHIVRIWSPSTTSPRSSTRITRSASPSTAMPMSARYWRAISATCSGWVAPQPSLMLVPLGLLPTATTSAPSSSSTVGATL